MKAYTGYQHLYTVVYNEDGEYVDTVYPARGLAETVQQPTLEVKNQVLT